MPCQRFSSRLFIVDSIGSPNSLELHQISEAVMLSKAKHLWDKGAGSASKKVSEIEGLASSPAATALQLRFAHNDNH
jgi:hypothetical protein